MESIIEYANNINNINENNYFKKLIKNPQLTFFLQSQECFIDAVDNWSKLLGLLITKVPTDRERLIIIENLYDEHGNGDLSKGHVNTFKLFLLSLGYNNDIKLYDTGLKSYKYVNKFNESLLYSVNENWIFQCAMLGMIEFTYITVSTNIHNYVKNYIPANEINHYSLHEILDIKHATDLFSLITEYFESNKADIINGLETGYTFINNLYESLSEFL
jgi:hypothetical protein